ncbi:MAG: SH3 domain-containing protein [Bacteroidota bacterium]
MQKILILLLLPFVSFTQPTPFEVFKNQVVEKTRETLVHSNNLREEYSRIYLTGNDLDFELEYQYLFFEDAEARPNVLEIRKSECMTELCSDDLYQYQWAAGKWEKVDLEQFSYTNLEEKIATPAYFQYLTKMTKSDYQGFQYEFKNDTQLLIRHIELYNAKTVEGQSIWGDKIYEATLTLNAGKWEISPPQCTVIPKEKWAQLRKKYEYIGVMKDEDGYVNVREAASVKSNILTKVHANEAFYYNSQDVFNGWQKVFVRTGQEGYIHQSRVERVYWDH